MIRVRVTSATPVIVGHRQLLPGEIHEVAGGDLNAAVVLYGADAFKMLDGAPPVEAEPVETDDESVEDTDTEAEDTEAAPAGRRNRRKG